MLGRKRPICSSIRPRRAADLLDAADDPHRPTRAPAPTAPPQRFFFPMVKYSPLGAPVEIGQVDAGRVRAAVGVGPWHVVVLADGTSQRLADLAPDLKAALKARSLPVI